ncbi:12095_t:CDS:1, partial [Dentiscutata heterogama]
DHENAVEPEEFESIVYKKLMEVEDENNGQMNLEILITISSLINKLNETSKDKIDPCLLAVEVVKLCKKNDGYSYNYYKKYFNQRTKISSYTYW